MKRREGSAMVETLASLPGRIAPGKRPEEENNLGRRIRDGCTEYLRLGAFGETVIAPRDNLNLPKNVRNALRRSRICGPRGLVGRAVTHVDLDTDCAVDRLRRCGFRVIFL